MHCRASISSYEMYALKTISWQLSRSTWHQTSTRRLMVYQASHGQQGISRSHGQPGVSWFASLWSWSADDESYQWLGSSAQGCRSSGQVDATCSSLHRPSVDYEVFWRIFHLSFVIVIRNEIADCSALLSGLRWLICRISCW